MFTRTYSSARRAIKPPGKREDKLLATLYNKKRSIIHYHNLQQNTRHDLRVVKIHRILQSLRIAYIIYFIFLSEFCFFYFDFLANLIPFMKEELQTIEKEEEENLFKDK